MQSFDGSLKPGARLGSPSCSSHTGSYCPRRGLVLLSAGVPYSSDLLGLWAHHSSQAPQFFQWGGTGRWAPGPGARLLPPSTAGLDNAQGSQQAAAWDSK